jgi:hypothetical protein
MISPNIVRVIPWTKIKFEKIGSIGQTQLFLISKFKHTQSKNIVVKNTPGKHNFLIRKT